LFETVPAKLTIPSFSLSVISFPVITALKVEIPSPPLLLMELFRITPVT